VVGGNFRADNSDAFVRLLESSFGVTARSEGDEIVLGLAR
jgi:ferric-dicitrate binding protein FerR (iron transport regulator)